MNSSRSTARNPMPESALPCMRAMTPSSRCCVSSRAWSQMPAETASTRPSSTSMTVTVRAVATIDQAPCLNASRICSGRPASAAWMPEASIIAMVTDSARSMMGPRRSRANHDSVMCGVVAESRVVQIHSMSIARPRAIHAVMPSNTELVALSTRCPSSSLIPGMEGTIVTTSHSRPATTRSPGPRAPATGPLRTRDPGWGRVARTSGRPSSRRPATPDRPSRCASSGGPQIRP
jgi:hypothetical protein